MDRRDDAAKTTRGRGSGRSVEKNKSDDSKTVMADGRWRLPLRHQKMSGWRERIPLVWLLDGAGDAQRADEPVAKQQKIEAQFKDGTDPFNAAARFTVHDVIEPNETRRRIQRALELSRSRRSQQPGPTARYGVMP